jgi:chloride channel 3/4/5
MTVERSAVATAVALETLDGHIPDSQVNEIRRYEDFSTIDWVQDATRENRLRIDTYMTTVKSSRTGIWSVRLMRMYSAAQSWLVVAWVGSAIGLIAAFLSIVTEWLSDIKQGYCTAGFYLNEDFCCSGYDESCPEWRHWTSFGPLNYLLYIFFSTLFAFVAAILVYKFAPYAAGSGISEIKCIIAGFVMKGFLGGKTLFIKSVTLPLTIASGLSVGKEGPSVHYAACVGNTIAGLFPKFRKYNSKMREVLCACTAAGVAVAFGSPMGGVLFALEEMTSSFQLKTMWRSYFCALVATGVLASINPFRTGQLVLFSVKYVNDWHFFEIIPFVIIGLFGGFWGLFIIKWNLRAQAFRKRYLANYAVEEATILAAITAVICYFNPFLMIDMTESMQILFHECEEGWDNISCRPANRWYVGFALVAGVIIRTFLTIISYGSKVPAGIFVPSMAIGALFGRLVGTIMWALHDRYPTATFFASCPPDGACITPGTYALLGSAALLSGVMHITVTVVVVMFEVTGALTYILPTMIVVGVTKSVCDMWGTGGIADRTITANGYPFLDGNEEHVHNVPVELAMTRSLATLPSAGWTIRQVEAMLKLHRHQSYPVVDDDNYLIGDVWRSDLEQAVTHKQDSPDRFCSFNKACPPGHMDFARLVNFSPISVQSDVPSERVVEIFSKIGPRMVYVESHGKLCGLLTRKDILKYQLKTDYAISPPDNTAAEQMDQHLWDLLVKMGIRIERVATIAMHKLRGSPIPSSAS